MGLSPTYSQLWALGITLVVEGCGAMLITCCLSRLRRPLREVVPIVLLVNVVTHTIFWYTLPLLPGEATTRLLLYEIAITVGEGLVYQKWLHYRFWQGLGVSGLLNLLSYALGGWVWRFVILPSA